MGPLAGTTVLDLSRILTGPYCSMMLADLGAEVIKIERPGSGDDARAWGPPFAGGESAYFMSVNRNKKSMTLNLKDPDGRKIFLDLASRADVVLENFRPGTVDRLGVGYEEVARVNPAIVYCSLSGFGQDGPYSHRPGYDLILQGMGGLMGITGSQEYEEPVRVGVAVADIGAGMWAAYAIAAALLHRERTGQGQYIDVSLLDGQIAWLTYQAGNFFATGEQPARRANAHPNIVPYQSFVTRDGHINVAVGNDSLYRTFCSVVGLDPDDPRFATNAERVKNREQLLTLIEEVLSREPAGYWLERFEEAGIPCGPIYSLQQVFEDPQVVHRGMLAELSHPTAGSVRVTGIPMQFSKTPGEIHSPPPLLGEHTTEILKNLGYTSHEIEQFREKGTL